MYTYTLWPFGTFCVHLVHFSGFVIMYQEKSGNPESDAAMFKVGPEQSDQMSL
jgi:hypothetical protein